MRQPHESGALCAQRDAQRRGRQAARGDYPSTTLPGAVFWIVERCVCGFEKKKRVFVLIFKIVRFGCCARPSISLLALLRSQTQ